MLDLSKVAQTSPIDAADEGSRLVKFELISLTQIHATKKSQFLTNFSNVDFIMITPVNSPSGMVHLKSGENLKLLDTYNPYVRPE